MVREGRVFTRTGARPSYGIGYYVTAYEVGAQVTEASSGVTASVAAGHGFEADDKLIVGTDITQYRTVESVTSVTLVLNSAISLAEGDILTNLAQDTGTIAPNFDGNGLTVYTDMDYQNQAITNSVLSDSEGRYRYWHKGLAIWELVRDSNGTPFAIYLDAAVPADEDQVSYGIRYAHLFADGGTGTEDDPWTLTGSNPVQAAIDDLPDTGGTVHMVSGHFDLGDEDEAVVIPILSDTLDHRAYTITGAGRDLVFVNYSGTGTAFRYEGINLQSNQLVFSGFSVRQTGAIRTGNAFFCTYISHSLFDSLNIGNSRQDRQSGEPDYGFAYGVYLHGSPNVVDFNHINNCYFSGNTMGVYIGNQGDRTAVTHCTFEPRQTDTGAVDFQDGMEIHNSYGVMVSGNNFNFFGKASDNSNFGALKLSGNFSGHTVSGNYFEGNYPYSLYLLASVTSPQVNSGGVAVSGNSFSFTGVSASKGIQVGVNGGTAVVVGINIFGNGFYNLTTGNTGIAYTDQIKGFVEGQNFFDNVVAGAGTDRTLQRGCQGMILGGFTDNLVRPILYLIDSTQANGRVYLENTSTSSEASPSVQFKPGGAGARPSVSIQASAAGDMQVLDTDGTLRFSIDQSGNTTTVGTTRRSVSAAVTASTTQTQVGGTALTADINNISVCANANDTVTLPTAVAGMTLTLLNNGAQTLKIYPASGDNLGAGVDTSTTLAAGSNRTYVSFDATNWEVLA